MPSEGPNARLVLAASTRQRLEAVVEWLSGPPVRPEVLLVGPQRGAADDLLRLAGGAWLGVHRLTGPQLAHDLASLVLAREGRAPVSGLPVEALATRALDRCRGDLDYFGPVAGSPGFGRSLARTLLELRANEIESRRLEESGRVGADLARLLRAYEALLEERGLADGPAVWAAATTALEELPRHRLAGLPLVLLDALPTSRRELRFLGRLIEQAPETLATGLDGDPVSERGIAGLLGEGAAIERREPDAAASRRDRVQVRLFRAEAPDAGAEAEDSSTSTSGSEEGELQGIGLRSGLAVFAAAGESRETVEIARRIRDLAAEGDVAFDETAVLVRDPDLYLPLLEEAFDRADLPFWTTRGTVRPDPSGRAFLALLACAEEKLSASRFAEYLSLGQVPGPAGDPGPSPEAPPEEATVDEGDPEDSADEDVPWVEGAGDQLVLKGPAPSRPAEPTESAQPARPPVATPRRWEQLLVDAAVVGGRDRWRRRLRGLENELRRRIAEAEDPRPVRRRLERLLELERFALPIIDELDSLPDRARWGRWISVLERLASRTLDSPHSVLGVLADLRPMEEVGPIGLPEVRRVLEERLTTLRMEPPRRRAGRVFVATPDEALGRSFRVVFLPGLAEGIFPRRVSEDPLLLDEHRIRIGGLPTQEDRILEERRRLRIAVGAADEALVVSWPRLDLLQGRARVPSLYALDVLRAADGRLPDLPEIETAARRASPSTLGWPAPENPLEAIDDAEFDLSWLAPLLRPGQRTEADPTGRGRYLLSVNDALDRSLRQRWLRWHASSLTPADGLVDDDGSVLEALERHRLGRRSYSPTALQHYAACPYRFLLSAIHRLRPRDEIEPIEQMDPLTRGSLFHEVQFRLFQRLAADGLLPMREEDREELFDRNDAVLDELSERWHDELAPAIETIWQNEIEGIRADLRGWIQTVIERDGRWTPRHFELAFGLREREGRDPSSTSEPVPFDGARLRGSIDLVEHDPERDVFRVTDHKTGRARGRQDLVVGGGETLQPLLYSVAAEALLERPVESGRLFFCTRRGDYRTVEVEVGLPEREAIRRVLGEIDHAVESGLLPALPREKACRYCDFVSVCGPREEMRTERKSRDRRAARLHELRGMK